jgi:hypothetical protein
MAVSSLGILTYPGPRSLRIESGANLMLGAPDSFPAHLSGPPGSRHSALWNWKLRSRAESLTVAESYYRHHTNATRQELYEAREGPDTRAGPSLLLNVLESHYLDVQGGLVAPPRTIQKFRERNGTAPS